MLSNDVMESKISDIFKLLNQNRADYQTGILASDEHAQRMVNELREELVCQLKIRFEKIDKRLAALESVVKPLDSQAGES